MRSCILRCVLLAVLVSTCAAAPLRVAVLGDSISTGAHALDRPRNGYPARLGHLLGDGYEVRAFAQSSRCLLRQADLPLAGTPQFKAALAWKPDVALIMLGTNDSSEKRPNWKHHAALEDDMRYFLSSLRTANPEVVVHLLGPPPMFPDKKGMKPERRADLKQRAPHLAVIRENNRRIAAAESRVYFHDLARTLDAETTSDGVHPDPFGHEKIARHLRDLLTCSFDEKHDVAALLSGKKIDAREGKFHGFQRYDFSLPGDGARCTVVAPHQAATGHPWIWRARFFGHQPALDLSLLDRGFHLAYCDVGNLYGAPKALDRWDAFYALATAELDLARKPVLEGMSRGGLPMFWWASRNPGKVAAIYGDNPVCDFRSWPGGKNGMRSDRDWQRCLKAHGIGEEQAAGHPQPRDADVLRAIATAKVPVALVLGMDDKVVPPAENGDVVAAVYARLGGPVKVWHKPGDGHHPHGLHPPDTLQRYLRAAAGHAVNPAAMPSPSSEYRSGAGWGKSNWHEAFATLKKVAADHQDAEVVFLGDSITQGLSGHGNRVSSAKGKRPFDTHCGAHKALSLGLSGERTEHILWRLSHGQLDGLKPKTIVLMIGVNNVVTAGHSGEEIAGGTKAIVAWLREHQPQARIVLLGCFPAGGTPEDPRRAEIDALHRGIASMGDGEKIMYRDLRSLFLEKDGRTNARMHGDAIHINAAGQEAWLEAIKDLLP